jgi:hypothetical protein
VSVQPNGRVVTVLPGGRIVSTPKTKWAPCAKCGDPDGPACGQTNVTPARFDGRPYGVDGEICRRCRQVFKSRQETAERRARTGVVRLSRYDRYGEARPLAYADVPRVRDLRRSGS